MALGLLHTGNSWHAVSAAAGFERIAEIYYRYRLNNRVQLTSDLQWIQRAAGDATASTVRAVGLRARIGF